MATVGRLKDGDLLLTGEINERIPAVTNGLVAHFPFDRTARGINHAPIMDYSTWEAGQTGSIGSFAGYSSGNSRVMGVDPWGNPAVVWKSVPNGGIYFSPVPIDNTKMYRMSWWEKRVTNAAATYGRYYAGLNGYGTTDGVCNLSNGAYNTNPYFWSTTHTGLVEGEWFLFVGHVFPHDHTGTSRHIESGIYKVDGAHTVLGTDYKWGAATTTARSRTLAVYQGDDAAMEHHSLYPRMEICDGTEPTIKELLMAENNIIHPSSNVNTTFTPEGIAIEESTVNYLASGLNGYTALNPSHWNGDGVFTEVGVSLLDTPIFRYETAGSSYRYTHDYVLDNNLSALSGKTVTFSLYLRRLEGEATAQIRIYDNISSYSNQSVSVTTDFQKVKMTKTIGANPTRMFVMIDNTGGGTYEFHSPQLEEKPFATAFVNGSRSDGSLSLFKVIPVTGDYTVNFKMKNNTTVGNPQSYASVMSFGDYYSNNSWTIMDSGGANVTGSLGLIRKGNSGEWGWATTSLTSVGDLGQYITLTIVRDSTNYKCYNNGVLRGSIAHASGTMQDYLWVGGRQSGGQIDSADFKDLSVYSRALSEEEVVKLHGGKMSVGKEGSLKAVIKEELVQLLDNYIPLGSEGQDSGRYLKPSTEENIIYDDGASWVGNTTTNIYDLEASPSIWPSGGSNMNSITTITSKHSFVVKGISSVAGAYSYVYPKITTTNVTHCLSFKIRNFNSKPLTVTYSLRDGNNGEALGATKATVIQPGQCEYLFHDEHTPVTLSQTTASISIYSDSVDGSVNCEVFNIQTEARNCSTPFVSGTRGDSKMAYTTLDTNAPWTVGVFVKPNKKAWEERTRNPIMEIGSYYLPGETQLTVSSWATTNNYISMIIHDNRIGAAAPGGHLLLDTDFDNWVFVVLRFDGANLFLDSFAKSGHRKTQRAKSWTSPIRRNIFVGSYGWADSFNGQIKDLFLHGAMVSDTELEDIYKTQMRASKDNQATIQGQIREGKVL